MAAGLRGPDPDPTHAQARERDPHPAGHLPGADHRPAAPLMLVRPLIALLVCCPLAAAAPPARRIIDVHMHAEPSDDPRFGTTWTSPLTGRVMKAAPDEPTQMSASLEAMRRLNIVKAVVSGAQSEAMRWEQRAPDHGILRER